MDSRPLSVRFGSIDSIDEDRVYVFPELPSLQECKNFCDSQGENRNIVVIRQGVVVDCYKGLPDETNNAIYRTSILHPENGAAVVAEPVHRIVPLKVLRAVRVILSLLTRTSYRDAVKTALNSWNFAQRKEVLAGIDFDRVDLSDDAVKSASPPPWIWAFIRTTFPR